MKRNEKSLKHIKFQKINFKNAKRFSKNKNYKKKISFNNQNISNPKNESNNISNQTSAMISFLKNIENKYPILQNKIIFKNQSKDSSFKRLTNNNIKNIIFRQQTYKTDDKEKKEEYEKSPKPTQKSPKCEKKYKNYKSKLQRCKTFCKKNNNSKDLNSQENEQETYYNINLSKDKKINNCKKDKKHSLKRISNEKNKIKGIKREKEKCDELVNKVKKKFLCCFSL